MRLGHKIRYLRRQAQMTQRQLSKAAGLPTSYLSRLENERTNPCVGTLSTISEALKVPLAHFFDGKSAQEKSKQCPVTSSGRCILEQLFCFGKECRRQGPREAVEYYTSKHLKMLRMCNVLPQMGEPRSAKCLSTVMESLAALAFINDGKQLKHILGVAQSNG